MTRLDGRVLAGEWIHAHEEDTDHEMVFRRADAPLPPSRGRSMLSIAEDLRAVRRGPGPTDQPVSKGIVTLVGTESSRGVADTLHVLSYAPDRLVVEKG